MSLGAAPLTPGGKLDLAARRILMSAFLYYRYNDPVLDDGRYDKLSQIVADNFTLLRPALQWQMESAEAIRASGYHCKITWATIGGAAHWYGAEKGRPIIIQPGQWEWKQERGINYITAEG